MKLSKNLLATAVIAASGLTAVSAQAEVSATAGFVSDYYFRGLNLGDGGAYASLDYAAGGFYLGTWWIDDATGGNDGMENDWYIGYGGEAGSFSYDVGFVTYQYTYTSDFESEIYANFGIAGFSLGLAAGEDDNDGGLDYDYEVVTLGYEAGPVAATIGAYQNDIDGDYEWAEIAFSADVVEGLGATLSVGIASVDGMDDDGYMVLDISKSFDLF